MSISQRNWKRVQYEKGYPWLFFYARRAWGIGLLVTTIIVGVAGAFYMWYWQSGNDAAPDSIAGYGYAIAGTLCFLLAATLYTARRHSNKRTMGRLNTALNWHVFFAIMGTVFVFMHSFGNFYAKTGTYALYGLVALLVSGFVGRTLDHLVPRLIAGEVDTILTAQGEDRIESISRNLMPGDRNDPRGRQEHAFEADGQGMSTPWDMAYVSLESTSREIAHHHKGGDFTYASQSHKLHDTHDPLRTGMLAHPGELMSQVEDTVVELHLVQGAIRREQFYRYVIRYWRLLHIALALLAVGLIIWHLVYVAQLLIPTVFHRA